MGRVEISNGTRYLVDREGGIVLQQGQEIPVGARIARVGMSGRTTGPHLHWGLKYNGQFIDPALVLQAMFTQQAAS
jgi:murein DD-endopeptidase MepM/ murein hydrolase activator NlpD